MANKKPENPIFIERFDLTEKSDIGHIQSNLAKGRILFVDTEKFFETYESNVVVLKKTLDKLKNACIRMGGSVGRIGKDLLVLTPGDQVKLY